MEVLGLVFPDGGGGVALLDQAVTRGLLSARGVDKTMRLAWTIADLAGAAKPRERAQRRLTNFQGQTVPG